MKTQILKIESPVAGTTTYVIKLLMFILLSFVICLQSCSKKDITPTAVEQNTGKVILTDFNPKNGHWSTIVTINGSGFKNNPAMNVVKFNGKTAEIVSASTTELIVKVPKKAGTGEVTVENSDGKGTNATPFEFKYTITTDLFAGSTNGSSGDDDKRGIAASFFNPYGLATDADGNVYVGDRGNFKIRKIDPDGVVTTIATGITSSIWGVKIDGHSKLWVANTVRLKSMEKNGNDIQNYPGFSIAKDVSFDRSGNMYIAEGTQISIIPPSGLKQTFYQSSTLFPWGVTTDKNGNIYVTSNGKISKITPNKVLEKEINLPFTFPHGIVVDDNDNIYVACSHLFGQPGSILKISPDGRIEELTSDVKYPWGIALDPAGNLFVADAGQNQIKKITIN